MIEKIKKFVKKVKLKKKYNKNEIIKLRQN